jgi:hypothetical protein
MLYPIFALCILFNIVFDAGIILMIIFFEAIYDITLKIKNCLCTKLIYFSVVELAVSSICELVFVEQNY